MRSNEELETARIKLLSIIEEIPELRGGESRNDFLREYNAEIRRGRREAVKLSVPTKSFNQDPVAGRVEATRKKTEEFVQRVDFNEYESLSLLLETVELAILAPANMGRRLVEVLDKAESIAFVDEDNPEHRFELTESDFAAKVKAENILAEQIAKLRDWMNDNPEPEKATTYED